MNRLLIKIVFASALFASVNFAAWAGCPTPGATVIEVCNDAGGSSTIRAYFYDGTVPSSYVLFSITPPGPVSDPFGPVSITPLTTLPAGAIAGVEFGSVPDGDFIIRVNCTPSGFVNIGGFGIHVDSGDALDVTATVDPDCGPGADGEIHLTISGGTAPYNVTWPVAVTPIGAGTVMTKPGNLSVTNLDGGAYQVQIVDAHNCVITQNIAVPLSTLAAAGSDATVCGPTATLSGNNPGAGEIGTWTGPAGVTFSPNANAPNAVAGNLAVGANTLTWKITDAGGLCVGTTDDVVITSNDPATVNAGLDQTICAGSGATLNGSIGGSATSATWSGGGGSFSPNNTTLTATYTPSAAEVSAGTVTLTLTTNDPDGAGPCVPVADNITITINEAATVNAGTDQTICGGNSAALSGLIGGSATSATWSGGGGTFAPNNTVLNATYTPSAAEVLAGTVTLTLTTNDPDGAGPCVPASDNITLTINAAATVNAGLDQTICAGGAVTLNGSIGGSAASATWSGGGGTFAPNNTVLNATYTPSAAEVLAGTVTLTLTTNDPDGAGPCLPVADNVTIAINEAATVNAGTDQTICGGNNASLSGSIGGSATSATWSGGGGTFAPNNTALTATYTPSAAEVLAGTVTLTLTTNDPDGAGPCVAAVDNVTITINAAATVNAGLDQTICGGGTATLNGSMGGSATSATWSGGGGTFAPNNTALNATYTPSAAEVLAGTITLTLTTNDPDGAGPCVPVADNVTITINETATVNAGTDRTICAGSGAALNGTIGGGASSATWSGGGGSFAPNNTTLNATYTPSAAEVLAGTVTLTLTTNDPDGAGPCVAAVDNVTITINAAATVNAGLDQTICGGGTVTLNGSIGGAATSATWSGGGGTFAPNNTTLNATYTPSAAEVLAGTVTLTLTTNDPDGAGPCVPVADNVTITINQAATANAGTDRTICAGTGVTLNGTIGGGATSATWSGGTGTFTPSNTALTATYTPSAAEVTAGTVTLTLTTNDPDGAGPCVAAVDNMTITINPAATVNAGLDQTICAGSAVTLNGSRGGSATSATWSGGGGTFAPNNTTLNATYTPSAAEVLAGTVTLTLTTNNPAGPCGPVADNVTITINQAATVNAGSDQTICAGSGAVLNGTIGGGATSATWSGGAGTFTPGNTALNATYTPSAAEVLAGTVSLTLTTSDPDGAGPCVAATDNVTITINAIATVNAGFDQTICAGGTVPLNGSIGGSATSATWSGGAGSFAPGNTALNATYTPSAAEVLAGTVTLTLTTNDPDGAGPCVPVADNVTITINEAAIVNAGPDQTICAGSGAVLNGTIGGGATSATWSGGAGTFAPNSTALNATYTPSAAEVLAGTVTLTLTTNDPDGAGPCVAAVDNVTLTINAAATVNAGLDQTICAGGAVTLNGSFGGSATLATWSGGGGTFAPNNTTLNATYTPSAAEVLAGTVTLTLTSNDPDGAGPCVPVADNLTITINEAATVNAGSDQPICAGTDATLNGTIGGGATSATWSGGGGTFAANNTALNATYTPSAAEETAGTVTLTLTTNDPDGAGPCVAVSDNVTITINPAASVNAGSDQTICGGSNVVLNGTIGGAATSATWSGGGGTFAPNNTTLNATYTPSAAEVLAGTVTLTLTTSGSCPAVADNVTITINPAATVNANVDQTICAGGDVTLNGVIGGSATSATWSGGGGTFAPNNTTLSATYTPSAAEVAAGTVTLTLTTNDPDGAGPCVAVADNITITISPAATVNAGLDQTICAGGSATLNGTIGGSATSATWSGGGGTFAPNNTTLNATYTPSAAEALAGTVTLTLTTSGACPVATDNVTITINPAPTVSAGVDAAICADGAAPLNGVIGGSATSGTWSGGGGIFSPDNFTLNATYTPTAAEALAGTVVLTLTTNDPDGAGPCVAVTDNVTITINAVATVNAGTDRTVCAGGSTTLSGTRGGSATASIWSTAGDGTFNNVLLPSATYTPGLNDISAGTVTLTLTTNDPSGPCGAASDNVVITINSGPDPGLAVGVTIDPVCSGGTSGVTVSNSETGVSYQLRRDSDDVAVGSPVTGTGATITLSTGALAATTIFYVEATASGCTPIELTAKATVNVAGTINSNVNVLGPSSAICEGDFAVIVVASENGVNYQLRQNTTNLPIGAPVAGTGGPINLTTGPLAGTDVFNILASNGTCSVELTTLITVNVDINPDPGLTVGVTTDPVCTGGSTTITIANSENGVSYQLRNDAGNVLIGSPVAGTGGTIVLPTGNLAATTIFNILASSGTACAPVELTTKPTVNVTGVINAGLTVSAAVSPICEGSATDVLIDNSEAGVNYQLRRDSDDSNIGAPVAGTGGTINLFTGNLSVTTTFNVLASNGTCSIELTNKATVDVDVNPNPGLPVNVTIDPVCTGGISAVTIAGSETGVIYQLRDDNGDVNIGSPVSGNGATISLSTGVLNATTTFNILATGGVCAPVELATLATVNVAGSIDGGLNVVPSASPICAGSSTFIQVQNSESGVNYQLRNDAGDIAVGTAIAGNGGIINLPTGNLSATTTFNVLASNATCSIELTDIETITVNPSPNAGLSVSALPALICSGSSSSIIVSASEVGVSYQLRDDATNNAVGAAVAGTGGNIGLPTGNLTANMTYNVFATRGSCSVQLTAKVSVTIRAAGDPACGGGGSGDCATVSITPVATPANCANADGAIAFTISPAVPANNVDGVVIDIRGGTPRTQKNDFTFDNLTAGRYSFTVVYGDSANTACWTNGTVIVHKSGSVGYPEVNAADVTPPTCEGGSDGSVVVKILQPVDITGQTIQWSLNPGDPTSWRNFTAGGVITGLSKGTGAGSKHTVSIRKDASDVCYTGVEFVMPDGDAPSFDYTKLDPTCNINDGEIEVSNLSGGTAPYQISIDGSPFSQIAASETFDGLSRGNRSITLMDAMGCMATTVINLSSPNRVVLLNDIVPIQNPSCAAGGKDGKAFITIDEILTSVPRPFKIGIAETGVDESEVIMRDFPTGNAVTADTLQTGEYYVLISAGSGCPSRYEFQITGGAVAVDFDLEKICDDNKQALQLTNLKADGAAPFDIKLYDKFSGERVDSIRLTSIPVTKSYLIKDKAYLTNEFELDIIMVQDEQTFCTTPIESDVKTVEITSPLSANIGDRKDSYPDMATGAIQVYAFSGGVAPYDLRIELDSASSFALPFHETDFEEVELNDNQRFEKVYKNVPPGRYLVQVVDSIGCTLEMTARVLMDRSVYIPNIFTPNDDGANDIFYIRNLPIESGKVKLIITSRWGKEVYTNKNYQNDWKGEGAADGIYFYQLQLDGSDPITGWVEILRGQKP